MTIEIKKENWYLCMMWAKISHNRGDIMGMIWKEPDDCWRIQYRFRYYKDEKAFDSKDEKNWYAFKAPNGTEAEAMRAQYLFEKILKVGYETGHLESGTIIPINGDGDKVAEFFERGDRPWIHKQYIKEDAQ